MNFSSIKEIEDHFAIKCTDIESFERTLRTMWGNAHEDKAKESYNQQHFMALGEALAFVRESSAPVLPGKENDFKNLVVAVTDLVKLTTKKQNEDLQQQRFTMAVDSSIQRTTQRLRSVNVSGTVATSILGFIWLFPQSLKQSPILSHLVNESSFSFTAIWLYILLLAILFWIIVNRRENRLKRLKIALKIVDYQNATFDRFLYNVGDKIFSRTSFMMFIRTEHRGHVSPSQSIVFGIPQLEPDIVDELVNTILARAEEKGLIKKIYSPSLSDSYQVCLEEEVDSQA